MIRGRRGAIMGTPGGGIWRASASGGRALGDRRHAPTRRRARRAVDGRAAHEHGELLIDAVESLNERPASVVLDEVARPEGILDLLFEWIGPRRAAWRRPHPASPGGRSAAAARASRLVSFRADFFAFCARARSSAADCADPLVSAGVDTFDGDRDSKRRRLERHCQVLVDHRKRCSAPTRRSSRQ